MEEDFLQGPLQMDFLSDEFVHKNIRVRPYTAKDEELKENNQSRGAGMLSSGEGTDDEGENYNKIADI